MNDGLGPDSSAIQAIQGVRSQLPKISRLRILTRFSLFSGVFLYVYIYTQKRRIFYFTFIVWGGGLLLRVILRMGHQSETGSQRPYNLGFIIWLMFGFLRSLSGIAKHQGFRTSLKNTSHLIKRLLRLQPILAKSWMKLTLKLHVTIPIRLSHLGANYRAITI